jgi:hypothetical protein
MSKNRFESISPSDDNEEQENKKTERDQSDSSFQETDEFKSALHEREFYEPKERMSEREASVKMLAKERKELALQIQQERSENRDNISRLKIHLELLDVKHSMEAGDAKMRQEKLQELMALRAEQATTFAGRISKFAEKLGFSTHISKLNKSIEAENISLKLSEERAATIKAEQETLEELIASDKTARSIQEKLSEHYARAGEIANAEFERQQKSVEQVVMRNNAFILHALESRSSRREDRPHENSPISQSASLEDEMDILLSLEPSISTSSIKQDSENDLFANRSYGVILGGGEVVSARSRDITVPSSIKERMSSTGEISSSEEIDTAISNHNSGYDEILVNNPKIAGVFQKVEIVDGDSVASIYGTKESRRNVETSFGEHKKIYENELEDKVKKFRRNMEIAHERGVPQFILTENNRMFECLSVSDDGKINMGKEINPADMASAPAGFVDEKRIEAGNRVIEKQVMKETARQEEAKKIISDISGENYEDEEGEEIIIN